MLRTILVDNQTLIRSGIKSLLETASETVVIAEACSIEEAELLIKSSLHADLVLIEINLPGSLEFISRVSRRRSPMKIIALSTNDDIEIIKHAFLHGVSAYLLKANGTEELLSAVKYVQRGSDYLSPGLVSKFIKAIRINAIEENLEDKIFLSQREAEILQCVANGMTNSQIAERMFLSKRTVEGHRKALLEKTFSRNTAELVRYACRHDLVD